MIDLYASQPHYLRHLAPIWHELHRIGAAGTSWVAVEPVDALPGQTGTGRPHTTTNLPLLVAAGHDVPAGRGRPLVYVEHGAGQHYEGDGGLLGEPGGGGMGDVILFVCPGEHVAARWRARYPQTPAVAVGCPALDRWHRRPGPLAAVGGRRRLALTFHWDCRLVAESSTAWSFWHPMLRRLAGWAASRDVELLGHAHPRWGRRLDDTYLAAGIRPVHDVGEILETADVLVADNTSVMYEFASLDRPVVALNAPWWRRDVEHGLRFWAHPPGVMVDTHDELLDVLELEVAGVDPGREQRRAAVAVAYAATDGRAAERAAAAILEAIDSEGRTAAAT